ncbi:MAG TPA: KamA family radical SAM protein, partial [Planctomicrobium sp.]|nr:KamA family radical SAM protein [Planctomicrobium sp.]
MAGRLEILTEPEVCGVADSISLSAEFRSSPPVQTWQKALAGAIRDVPTLLARLGLPENLEGVEREPFEEFPLLVPESYFKRMRPGDRHDPLLRQVLPLIEEHLIPPGFHLDPVGDEQARVAPGMLHKYHGRALLVAHGSCAIHCRYCFRRHFPYQEEPHSADQWKPAIDAIRNDDSLTEIILSGGDPLILSDRRLNQLIGQLDAIPHLRRLRIHSRLPIVLPERVTDELVQLLTSCRLQTIFVVHSNHAQELTGDCADALKKLRCAGIPVLNQAVLLKGVNDNIE